MAMKMAEKLLKHVQSQAGPLTYLQEDLLEYVSSQIQNTMDLVGTLIKVGQAPPGPSGRRRRVRMTPRGVANVARAAGVHALKDSTRGPRTSAMVAMPKKRKSLAAPAVAIQDKDRLQRAFHKLKNFGFDLDQACLYEDNGESYLTGEELKELAIKAKVQYTPKGNMASLKRSLRVVDWAALAAKESI